MNAARKMRRMVLGDREGAKREQGLGEFEQLLDISRVRRSPR